VQNFINLDGIPYGVARSGATGGQDVTKKDMIDKKLLKQACDEIIDVVVKYAKTDAEAFLILDSVKNARMISLVAGPKSIDRAIGREFA
jgi:hypothetical protein